MMRSYYPTLSSVLLAFGFTSTITTNAFFVPSLSLLVPIQQQQRSVTKAASTSLLRKQQLPFLSQHQHYHILQMSKQEAAATPAPAAALTQEELKKLVGYKAVDDYIKSGMVIGLGTGSTAYYAVERVGQKLVSGELTNIVAIPTSIRTKEQAESLNIPLSTLDSYSSIDVSIDGADHVDPNLHLTKGGGGALFREKIVEIVSKQFIVIVDESKIVNGLGPGFPIPVEIVPFCHEHTIRIISQLSSVKQYNGQPILRMGNISNNKNDGDTIAITDNGNYIVDIVFNDAIITDPITMGLELKNVVGVVEHGLFCNMASAVIIAGTDGITVKLPPTK